LRASLAVYEFTHSYFIKVAFVSWNETATLNISYIRLQSCAKIANHPNISKTVWIKPCGQNEIYDFMCKQPKQSASQKLHIGASSHIISGSPIIIELTLVLTVMVELSQRYT